MKKTKLFESYITKNIDNAYRFAFTYTRNKEDAEDILNESVVKALRSINSLKNPDYIKPWFFKIIANTALNNIKTRGKVIYMNHDEMDLLEASEEDYSNLNFMELVEKLEPKYKTIIVLRFFENMTIGEVSEVLEINESTVKTRLYKALRMLKVDIEGEF